MLMQTFDGVVQIIATFLQCSLKKLQVYIMKQSVTLTANYFANYNLTRKQICLEEMQILPTYVQQ